MLRINHAKHRRVTPRGRRMAAVALAFAVAVLGTYIAPTAGASTEGIRISVPLLQSQGIRNYRLFAPTTSAIGGDMPLLIVLHSLGHTNTEVEQSSGMDDLAVANRFAVAYPVGINLAWNAGMCCTTDPSGKVAQTDDVDFLANVISSVAALVPIDRHRVYVAGFSNGAMMALRFACERPDLVAGVISVAGTLESSCNPDLPVRLLALHGDQDHTVPYNGSRFSPFVHAPLRSIPATVATFATIDGCTGATSSYVTTALVRGYARCHGGSVTLVTIRGAGHIWPTLDNSGYDSASAIWTFMSAGAGA